jgi:hypothetical protein
MLKVGKYLHAEKFNGEYSLEMEETLGGTISLSADSAQLWLDENESASRKSG